MLTPSFRLFELRLAQPWSIASRRGADGAGIRVHPVWLVRLVDHDGVAGYGEASPVAQYSESPLTTLAFFNRLDWSQLDFQDLAKSLAYLHRDPTRERAARAAIDMALHDGVAKKRGQSLAQLLNIDARLAVSTCYSLGISDPVTIAEKARLAARFHCLKLKAGPDGLADSLKALRAVAPEKPIRVDANEAWRERELALRNIELLARDGKVEFVEQPMPRNTALEDLVWLRERSPLPLVADESYQDSTDIGLCREAFHGVNVKLAKMGGVSRAKIAIDAALLAGLDVQLGCMIESSLSIAAALALAPRARWLDLDGALLTTNDPFSGVSEIEGRLVFDQAERSAGIGTVPVGDPWDDAPPELRPIAQRATTATQPCEYGRSLHGLPLHVWLPSHGATDALIFACIHGEESETTALLSKALRSLDGHAPRCAIVLCANPDGTLAGTRCNARGVELNRNFPTSDWQPGFVSTKWAPDHGRVDFSTGARPCSEPETQALIQLVESLRPQAIIALHAPLACIEDDSGSPLGRWLAERTGLPLVPDVGYPTPGSFGNWAKENGWLEITYELPPVSVSALHEKHLPALTELLQRGLAAISSAVLQSSGSILLPDTANGS